jgi:hypothetical protein
MAGYFGDTKTDIILYGKGTALIIGRFQHKELLP